MTDKMCIDDIADRALYVKYDLEPLVKEDKILTDLLRHHMTTNNIQAIPRPGGMILLRKVSARRFNLDRFKADHPDLYEKYRGDDDGLGVESNQVWKTPFVDQQKALRTTVEKTEEVQTVTSRKVKTIKVIKKQSIQ